MEHKLHLYMGEGKGKTTAAMGLAVRMLGHGEKVLIAQFIKDGRTGELRTFRQIPNAVVWDAVPVRGFISRMNEEEKASVCAQQTDQTMRLAEVIGQHRPALTVLDELALALKMGIVEENVAKTLLDAALEYGEVAVTGRYAPDWLIEKADYVSEIAARKHPYQTEKLMARKGVEW